MEYILQPPNQNKKNKKKAKKRKGQKDGEGSDEEVKQPSPRVEEAVQS